MKILIFTLDEIKFKMNLNSISDLIRIAIYQKNELLFGLLEYENDTIFLEPSCFCFFLSDIDYSNKISLEQSLFGYILEEKNSLELNLKSDSFGLINLPNLGYIKAKPFDDFSLSIQEIKQRIIHNQFVKNSNIRLCLHTTDHLSYQKDVIFNESVELSLNKHQFQLEEAICFFQNRLFEFWQIIESVTREIVIFSSPNHNSFAGIMNQGTAYFNIQNQIKSTVFFIDDIAHQCGHLIFNILTLQTENYLKVPKEYPLAGFSPNPQESRGAYGAFHGLFTYTTILYALSNFIKSDFSSDENFNHEALGRIGFYMSKFKLDLQLMNNPEILTEEGFRYHKQFSAGFEQIKMEFGEKLAPLVYSNQPYTFQYDLFLQLNPINN